MAGCEPMTKIADNGNKSLLQLNYVVSELSRGRTNIDFKNSTLTTLLQESLSGNSNTAIICNINADAFEETISILQ